MYLSEPPLLLERSIYNLLILLDFLWFYAILVPIAYKLL
jgi:hypothetical protein